MLALWLVLAATLAPPAGGPEHRQPQLAIVGRQVAVTFGAGNAVYFAAAPDGDLRFSPPVKVAEAAVLALGRHRGPRIAYTGRAIVISAIVGEKGRGQDGDLVAWRSTDGGRRWSKGVPVSDAPAAAREGLHAMAAGPGGRLVAAWLDMRGPGTELWIAVSADHGATWSKNRMAYRSPDGHICECCHPSAAIGPDGRIHLMFRNWLGGARDMYLATSTDRGQTFKTAKLGEGSWPLNACPMDGGAIAADRASGLVTVWRRQDKVFLSVPGQPERELAEGKDPAVGVTPEGAMAVWSSGKALWARPPRADASVILAEEGAYPSLAGGFAAWESKGAIVVEELALKAGQERRSSGLAIGDGPR